MFVPDASLDAGDGRMRFEHVWAALDCPGAFALMGDGSEDQTLVLGRMAARVFARPAIGETLVVDGSRLRPAAVAPRSRLSPTTSRAFDGRTRSARIIAAAGS